VPEFIKVWTLFNHVIASNKGFLLEHRVYYYYYYYRYYSRLLFKQPIFLEITLSQVHIGVAKNSIDDYWCKTKFTNTHR